jgi:hypothetical protein
MFLSTFEAYLEHNLSTFEACFKHVSRTVSNANLPLLFSSKMIQKWVRCDTNYSLGVLQICFRHVSSMIQLNIPK